MTEICSSIRTGTSTPTTNRVSEAVSGKVSLRPCRVAPPLYGTRELVLDIRRLRSGWKQYRRSRRRTAIYAFLSAILEMITIWRADGHARGRTRRALDRRGCQAPKTIDPFSDLIVAAAHPTKLDRRTLAKWGRVVKLAAEFKMPGRPFDLFVMRRGGINGCAALYTRRLGRKSKSAKKDRT